MDYISVRTAAENWGISERRVQKLCEQCRVPGAQRFGHYWMLPKDAQKPEDQRLTPGKEKPAHKPRPKDRKPLSMLREAWELKTHGLDEQFDALLQELLPLVKARQDERSLYGEWLLLSSFRHHPHLSEMTVVLKEAAPYFNGKCSRVILPSSLFPFASLSVFSVYHTEPGNAQEEARLLEKYITLYSSLTGGHGTGADMRGILLLELTHPDVIADWLKTGDFERLSPLPQLLPFAHFVHAQYLCRKGEFARLIGFAEARYPNGIEASPVLDALMSLTVASAYLNMGDKAKAEMLIQHAADKALPDSLVFPFVSYIQLLGGLLDAVVKKSYPDCAPAYLKIKSQLNLAGRRLSQHIVTITKTIALPDDLTFKERKVALLAAQGLRNTEIAQRLSVTENTVRYHLRSVFHKLDVDRRIKLAEKLL